MLLSIVHISQVLLFLIQYPLPAEVAMEAALPVLSGKMASLAHALHTGLKEQAASSP